MFLRVRLISVSESSDELHKDKSYTILDMGTSV